MNCHKYLNKIDKHQAVGNIDDDKDKDKNEERNQSAVNTRLPDDNDHDAATAAMLVQDTIVLKSAAHMTAAENNDSSFRGR